MITELYPTEIVQKPMRVVESVPFHENAEGVFEPLVFRVLPLSEYNHRLPTTIWKELQYELPTLARQRLLYHLYSCHLDPKNLDALPDSAVLGYPTKLEFPTFAKPEPATRLPPANTTWGDIYRYTIFTLIHRTSTKAKPTTAEMIIPVRCFSCGKVRILTLTLSLSLHQITLTKHYKLGRREPVGAVPREARQRCRGRVSLLPLTSLGPSGSTILF